MRGHYKNTVPPRRGGTVYAHARICLLPEFYGVANVRSIMVSETTALVEFVLLYGFVPGSACRYKVLWLVKRFRAPKKL